MITDLFGYVGAMAPLGGGIIFAGLLGLFGHGQPKPVRVTTGSVLAYRLPEFGESRKRVGYRSGEILSALVALVVSWMGQPSQVLYVVVFGACGLFMLDYTTAHRAARLAGEQITTKKIREMTAAKILSYWIMAGAFSCLALMLRTWLPIIGIFSWIAYCEVMSNLENARKIALASGKTGTLFFGGAFRLANKVLGELPGVKDALGGDVTISQTTTTDRATTTTTQTDTQVHVSPAQTEQKVGN